MNQVFTTYEELTEKRHIVDQKIYYHGTIDLYLKSLFTNGLLPDNKNTIYKKNEDENFNMVPFGGVYLTKEVIEAWGYCLDKIEKLQNTTISEVLLKRGA